MNHLTPPIPNASDSLTHWRSEVLRKILIGASIAGIFALPPAFAGSPSGLFTALYIGVYVVLIGVTTMRFSYRLKSTILLLITYGLGVAGLLDTSIWGDSRTFMIAFIVFANMLVSSRAGWGALALTLATYAVAGWFILNNIYILPGNEVNIGNLFSWFSGATTVALVSIAMMQGSRALQAEFGKLDAEFHALLKIRSGEQAHLEERVTERTKELNTRTLLLSTAAQVARRISVYQNQQDLVENAVEFIASQFGYHHAAIYIFDKQNEYAYIQSASSEAGKKMVREGVRIDLSRPGLLQSSFQQRQTITQKSMTQGTLSASGVELPESLSQIALPLIYKDSIMGIMDIQSTSPDGFPEANVEALQIATSQLALVIESTRLANEVKAFSEQLGTDVTRQSQESWKKRKSENIPGYQYTPLGVQTLHKRAEASNDTDEGSLNFPITLRNQKLGALNIKRKAGDAAWDEQERTIIREIADQMSLALENARLLEDAQRRVAFEQEIAEITAHIGASFDVDSILRITAQEIGRALSDSEVVVALTQNPEPTGNTAGGRK